MKPSNTCCDKCRGVRGNGYSYHTVCLRENCECHTGGKTIPMKADLVTQAEIEAAKEIRPRTRIADLLGGEGNPSKIHWPYPNTKTITDSEFWNWKSVFSRGSLSLWCRTDHEEYDTVNIYLTDCYKQTGGGLAVVIPPEESKRPVRYFTWSKCAHNWEENEVGCKCTVCGDTFRWPND